MWSSTAFGIRRVYGMRSYNRGCIRCRGAQFFRRDCFEIEGENPAPRKVFTIPDILTESIQACLNTSANTFLSTNEPRWSSLNLSQAFVHEIFSGFEKSHIEGLGHMWSMVSSESRYYFPDILGLLSCECPKLFKVWKLTCNSIWSAWQSICLLLASYSAQGWIGFYRGPIKFIGSQLGFCRLEISQSSAGASICVHHLYT